MPILFLDALIGSMLGDPPPEKVGWTLFREKIGNAIFMVTFFAVIAAILGSAVFGAYSLVRAFI